MVQNTQEALLIAIDDEFRARATYESVLGAYGNVAPFNRIEQAEQRHIAALASLFPQYGMAVPADRWTGNVQPPSSLLEACELGVAAEIANYQMYDDLLQGIEDPQVRFVFNNVRDASVSHHLPAFQSCAEALKANAPSIPASTVPSMRQQSPGMDWSSVLIGGLLGAGVIWLWRQWSAGRP